MATSNIYDMADTWNDGGVTFTSIKMNVTNTASNAASLLIDLLVGGTSRFRVSNTGLMTVDNANVSGNIVEFRAAGTLRGAVDRFGGFTCSYFTTDDLYTPTGGLQTKAAGKYGWSSSSTVTGTIDTTLTRVTAAVVGIRNASTGAGAVSLSTYTVATLPAAATVGAGAVAFASDANATTARSTVAGGGSNMVLVMSNGTNWLIVA